jgi:hypothetical protein
MFVFHRSFWTVAAGLGTALAVVMASLILDRMASEPPAGPAVAASDISLARR